MTNYSKAYTEVLEILTYLPEEEQKKIPIERIEFYFDNRDKEYDFHYDENIPFDEQKVLPETQAVIVTLFRDYFATNEQKEKLEQIIKHNDAIQQERFNESFHYENIFRQNERISDEEKTQVDAEDITKNEEEMIDTLRSLSVVKDNFFTKMIKKIKNYFKRNNKNGW